MKMLKAIPTTYKKIRFRSKSEAIFAVALDEIPNAIWRYEPKIAGLDCSVDFQILHVQGTQDLYFTFVEYKPAKPSQDYVESRCRSFKKWLQVQEVNDSDKCVFLIVYGSPWKNDGRVQQIDISELIGHAGVFAEFADYIQPSFIRAREYRFDLASE